MKKDCCFTNGNSWFRYRTGAILVKQDCVLLVKSRFADHLYLIGGGVHMGETSQDCVCREIYEETGIVCKELRAAVICENFYKGKGGSINGFDCHTIELYYVSKDFDDAKIKTQTDDDEELVWVPIREIKDVNVKPCFLKERMEEIVRQDGLIHIVEQSDR